MSERKKTLLHWGEKKTRPPRIGEKEKRRGFPVHLLEGGKKNTSILKGVGGAE